MTATAERPAVDDASPAPARCRTVAPTGRRRVPRWWRDAVGALTWASMLVVVALWVAGGGAAGPRSARRRADQPRPADRARRLRPAAHPGAAHGPDPRGRAVLRPGRAGPPAPPRRLHLVQPHGRPHRADRRRLRGDGAGATSSPRRGSSSSTTPGMLLAVAGTGCARHGHRDEHQEGPPQAALRVVAPAAPVCVPRGRSRPPPPAVDRPGVPGQHGGHRLLVGPLGRGRRRGAGLAGRGARSTARSPTTCGSPRSPARAPTSSRSSMSGRRLDRLPVAAGQFFTWRFLTGPGWLRGHPYSLSAAPTGTSLRISVKDLGDGSRELAALKPGTRVVVEGPYGTAAPGRPDPPQGDPARQRHRRHPAARPARGAAPGAGRRHPRLPGPQRAGAGLPGRARRPGPQPRRPRALRARVAGCPTAPPGCPTPPPTSPTPRGCSTSCPTSPSTTSTSAAPAPGWTPSPTPPRRPAYPPQHIHQERFTW